MIEIKVPELSESISEATLLDWKKNIGDSVAEGDVLVEVETDKITMEIYAPSSGVLDSIHLLAGASVKSGELLAHVKEGAAPPATSPQTTQKTTPPTSTATDTVKAMPSAKKIATEQGVELNSISGTGKGGRVTKADVLHASTAQNKESTPKTMSVPTVPTTARAVHRVPMSKLRARIAERLLESQQQTATLSTFNEVNMQAIINLRASYREQFEKKHGIKLGFMSFFTKAAVAALKEFPVINASVEDNNIVYHEYYDIGVAVSTGRGLIVPIVRDADLSSMADIEKTITDYGQRAKTGSLNLDEITGGTFSITNGGVFGSMLSTPIINPPQSAILGIHATKERAVVENGEIVIRPMCYFALSYDHRIIDGREAVQFLVMIKNALEDPARLLLEI